MNDGIGIFLNATKEELVEFMLMSDVKGFNDCEILFTVKEFTQF